jgi:excisionase family DNA binding protein
MDDVLFTQLRLHDLEVIIQTSIRKILDEYLPKNQVQHSSPSDLLNIDDAAVLLNLAKPTIYGLVSTANVPNMKKGKKLYFSRHELEDWIKSGRRKTSAEKKDEINALLIKTKKSKKSS